MSDSIHHIIFDFGNVILPLDIPGSAKAMTELLHIPYDAYHQEMPEFFRNFEKGILSESGFIDHLRTSSGQKFSDTEFKNAWNAILLKIPESRIELLKKLRTKYKLYLLSNTNETHLHEVKKTMGHSAFENFESIFTRCWYSCEIGYRKPDEEAFEFILRDADIAPGTAIFIDDGRMHIDGAKQAGLHARWHDPQLELADTMQDFLLTL